MTALAEKLKNANVAIKEHPNRDTVLDFISEAETNHGFIGLTDYESNTGRRANYIIQPYGQDAYIRLVRESLEQLEAGTIEMPSQVYGETVTKDVWEQAVAEQIASFEKTLNGGHNRQNCKVKVNKGFYAIDDIPYIFNVRIVSYFETNEQSAHNATLGDKIKRIPKNLKSKIKAYIRNSVALSNYRGQFQLSPDKFKRIAFGKNEIASKGFGILITP